MQTLAPSRTIDLEMRIGASTRLPRVTAGARAPFSAERLVLTRWRRFGLCQGDGATYDGCQLPSSLWRVVAAALRAHPALLRQRVPQLTAVLAETAQQTGAADRRWAALPYEPVVAFLRKLRPQGRLDQVLGTQADGIPLAVPDLMLYQERMGTYGSFYLLDVKMPRARVRADRLATLETLRALRLTAGIVRLRDRGAWDEGWLSKEALQMIDESVDREMEAWARSLILMVDGEIRKPTEEEVQLMAGKTTTRQA